MRLTTRWTIMTAAAGFVLCWHAGDSGAQPAVLETEVTADGLHRVDPSVMRSAWVRPGGDLSRYTRMFFMPTLILFREMPEPPSKARMMENRAEFPVGDLMRARLSEAFGESFYEAVSGVRRYELSKELGRDVLMVQGLLTDVVSGIPPDLAGSNVGTVRWAWEANIVIELRDSMSNEVLARTRDRERIEGPFDADGVWALAPVVTHSWSRLLVRRLRELSSLYPSRLRRLYEQSNPGEE